MSTKKNKIKKTLVIVFFKNIVINTATVCLYVTIDKNERFFNCILLFPIHITYNRHVNFGVVNLDN